MIAGQLEVILSASYEKLAQDLKDAERTTGGSMERIGALIGAGMAAGWEKAKDAWVAFKEWSERQIAIWGIALVIGVSAAIVGAVYAAFKAISFAVGLLTGESYKSANIDALTAMNKEVKTLQQNLPLTAAGASALNEALKTQGTSAEAYAATLYSVSSAVRTNQSELDRLGVTYKDRNGNFLTTTETLKSAAGVLATYTEGWDRNQAALAIGMGSEKQIQAALSVTAEKIQTAKDRLIDYGLIIGTDTQAAVTRYEESMRAFNRELDLTSQGFSRAIADNIMPALTDLADFFREGFPTAVMAFRYSFATITSLFYGLKTSVFIVAEAVLGAIQAMGIGIGGLATASYRALTGDFSGAKEALVQGWTDAQKRLALIGDNIVEQAQRNAAAMRQAWGSDSFGANNDPNAKPKTGQSFVPADAASAADKAAKDKDAELIARALQAGMDEETKVMAEAAQIANDFRAAERAEIQRHYDERNQILIDAYDREQAEAIRHGEEQIAIDASIAAIRKAQDAAEAQGRMTFLNNLAGLMNTQSRKVFEIGKIGAIAQAGYKGALAVMDAWEAGMSTGGPWAPVIAAGYAAAAGLNALNLINNIKSQTFGGSAGGVPVSPGQGSSGVLGGGLGSGAPSFAERDQQSSQIGVTVIVQGNIVGNEDFVENTLIPAIKNAVDNKDFTLIGRNSRQAAELTA